MSHRFEIDVEKEEFSTVNATAAVDTDWCGCIAQFPNKRTTFLNEFVRWIFEVF